MNGTDYFQISKRRHYLQLDPEAVREHAGAGFEVEQDPHPFVEIDGRPTMAAYRYIRDVSGDDVAGDQLAEVTLAVCIRRLGGDWRLYAGAWGVEAPVWPDLCDEGGIEVRRQVIARLFDVDLIALSEVANEVMTVDEAVASE